jgi:hypothetical protein
MGLSGCRHQAIRRCSGRSAPQAARRCADLFDEVEWHNAQLPLRQWLESIRDFYHKKPFAKAVSLVPICI